jgi:hypothetical protein
MALEKCTICSKSTKNKCSRCKSAAYCSQRCQKLDLPLHKLLCSKYQDFLTTRPDPTDLDEPGDNASAEYEEHDEDDEDADIEDREPAKADGVVAGEDDPCTEHGGDENSDDEIKRLPPVSIAALLFPMFCDYPQLIWLKCQNWIEYGALVSAFNGSVRKYSFARQLLLPTKRTQNLANIELWMEDEFGRSPANQCLSMLNEGYGAGKLDLSFPSCCHTGSIIVVNSLWGIMDDDRAGELEAGCEYQDVTLSDLRYAFTYLTRHNNLFESDIQNPYCIRQREHWVKGVKMYADGHVKNDRKKKFQEVEVSALHSIFRGRGRTSSITQKMGFPLLMKEGEVDERWRKQWKEEEISDKERGSDPWEHTEVGHLMVITDMKSELYGSVDRDLGPVIGPITPIVVRKDMKGLTARQPTRGSGILF